MGSVQVGVETVQLPLQLWNRKPSPGVAARVSSVPFFTEIVQGPEQVGRPATATEPVPMIERSRTAVVDWGVPTLPVGPPPLDRGFPEPPDWGFPLPEGPVFPPATADPVLPG